MAKQATSPRADVTASSLLTPHAPYRAGSGAVEGGGGATCGTSRDAAEQMFVDNLPMIQRLIATVARQHRFGADEAEEFAAAVQLRLIESDYLVLRKFRGQCSLRTFLTVVLQRMCLDARTAQWGKWRPSADSRRGGDVAILLDRLTMRDGFSFEEACSILEVNHGRTIDRDELARVFASLRQRVRGRPRMVSDDELDVLPAATDGADQGMLGVESRVVVAGAAAALGAALSAMPARDRLVIQLRYVDGLTLASIARLLHIPQKPLYRQLERLLATLRQRLEAHGVRRSELIESLASVGMPDPDPGAPAWTVEASGPLSQPGV